MKPDLSRRTIRIGAGAGFSGDRIEPAVELAREGRLDFLVFECLAERTIALAQRARRADPDDGYDPLLAARMRAVLPICAEQGIRIITNMGAANPRRAARRLAGLAGELGLAGLSIAAVFGDDVLQTSAPGAFAGATDAPAPLDPSRIISANAYLGAAPMVEALDRGAQVVITGRVADPSLFLAPLVHGFGWRLDDWDRIGRGTLVGHLLECAGQITGGYFADPGVKDAPDLARLGFPLAEVDREGFAVIEKPEGSGGCITVRTCTEQLLYELADPSAYLTPDVCADFSQVCFEAAGPDRIRVSGARGRPAPETLKVSVGYEDGFVGEGQISYAGPGAVARARLALDIVRERLRLTGVEVDELRGELIGVDSIHCSARERSEPAEVRLRVAGRARTLETAQRIGEEVESLYTNGPAGGGGARKFAEPVVAIASAFIDRSAVAPVVELVTA